MIAHLRRALALIAKMVVRLPVLFGLLLFINSPSYAELKEQQKGSFTISISQPLNIDIDGAYKKFLNVKTWWNPSHTYSGDSRNLRIDNHCFCEQWENKFVQHLQVLQLIPGKLIVFSGGLGPLQTNLMQGLMAITFSPGSEGSTIKLEYQVWSAGSQVVQDLGPAVEGVLLEQITRFVNTLDVGG